jgi:hypothetical protein
MRSESGARGRNDTLRSRAALGIMLTGITTGPGGAFPGLGQAGAGNARLAARSLSPPGWGELDKTMRSRHVPGSLTWSCAQRAKAPTARAVVERRQASASADRAPRASAEDGHIRLSAFRFLFFFVARMEHSVIRDRHSSSQIVSGFRFAPSGLHLSQNSGADASRERFCLFVLPRLRGRWQAKLAGRGKCRLARSKPICPRPLHRPCGAVPRPRFAGADEVSAPPYFGPVPLVQPIWWR